MKKYYYAALIHQGVEIPLLIRCHYYILISEMICKMIRRYLARNAGEIKCEIKSTHFQLETGRWIQDNVVEVERYKNGLKLPTIKLDVYVTRCSKFLPPLVTHKGFLINNPSMEAVFFDGDDVVQEEKDNKVEKSEVKLIFLGRNKQLFKYVISGSP